MNLYVGNLPYNATEQDLKNLFSEIGEVQEVKILIDQATGKPKGFGFVEMVDSEEAIIAMKVLNGRELLDRNLVVNLAEQKQNKPEGRDRFQKRGGFGGGRNDGNRDRNYTPRDRNYTPREGGSYTPREGGNYTPREGGNYTPRDGNSRPPYKKSNN